MEKIKIPSIPIYNSEQYIDCNPIHPDSLANGQTYVQEDNGDILYISYMYNGVMTCIIFDSNGNYINTTSERPLAVATFLNNNNWKLYEEELVVINPLNTEEEIVLNKKKQNESKPNDFYNRLIENSIRRIFGEGILNDEGDEQELDSFEEYEKGYPNDNFDVSDMTSEDLAKWCQNVGDFRYIYIGLRGWQVMVANDDYIVASIVEDLHKCNRIEPTHEMDYLLRPREKDFIYEYICVFKVIGVLGGDYYVVYYENKNEGKHPSLQESKGNINEAFKSDKLRQWFKEHGGVMNRYRGEKYNTLIDKRVSQDGLGDIPDDAILYIEEFNDYNEAIDKKHHLTHHNTANNHQRTDWGTKAFFTIYKANDGTALLVGVDRNKVDTGITWGSERTSKTADRINRNGWNFKTRSNRYADDSDTYYYGQKSNHFGLKTNNDFKGKQKDNNFKRSQMSDTEWKDYMDGRIERMQNYIRRRDSIK